MNNFIFGQYIPGTSPVHRMNSASKFLLSVIFIVMALLSNNWSNYLELLILIGIGIVASRVSFRVIYRGIRPLLLIIIITAVLQLFFDPRGTVLMSLGALKVTVGGLNSSGHVFCRFFLIIIVSTLLTLSTPPTELANGIRIILKPLSYFKVPVDVVSLMISIALRFIPTLYQELKVIMKAQRSRGMLFRSGSLLDRAKKLAMLIVPLLFSSFERARKLSYAMLSRGYQTGAGRTQLRQSHLSYRDDLAWVIYIVFGTLEIITRG